VILAIDCGNTRAKWGLHSSGLQGGALPADHASGGHGWRRLGSVPLAEIEQLQVQWQSLPEPQAIAIAHVAGNAAREPLAKALARFRVRPIWVCARHSQCGVTNGYAEPGQLGADRWAALIAARHAHAGPSLVVNAGTATTVDLLSSSGLFRGGLILPGLDLMKQALAARTAGLPLVRGEFVEAPRNTADAIETGCLLAQLGAIEKMHARLEPGALCLLSGGAALRVAGRLNIPVRVVEDLVLEGLVRIACS
jgi:type III pantothenate kinase